MLSSISFCQGQIDNCFLGLTAFRPHRQIETREYQVRFFHLFLLFRPQIDKKAMHKSGMVQRVTNEVEIQCRLKHPSILEVKLAAVLHFLIESFATDLSVACP